MGALGCEQDAINARVPPVEDDTPEFRPLPDILDVQISDISEDSATQTDLFEDPSDIVLEDTDALVADAPPQDTNPPQDSSSAPLLLVRYLDISRIDLYQTVRVPWMQDQRPAATTTPIVAGRATLVRVFVMPQPGWTPQLVTAELTVKTSSDEVVLTHTRDVFGASSDADTTSTFHFRLDPSLVTRETQLSVRLTVTEDGDAVAEHQQHPASWPLLGEFSALGARDDGGPLKVMLVPLRYGGDGSGRLPDTSPAQLQHFDSVLRALYPSTDVQLQVHEALSWNQSLDFGSINQFLVQLKEDERAADDLYYYALIKPADSFEDYCNWSCTTGQSYTVDDGGQGIYRVGSGVGFSGEDWAWTLAHELGHMHGRGHAPCDVSWWSDDDAYPYSGGVVGVWGWDMRDGQFKTPEDWTDMMGYCDVQWMSDYTYEGLYARAADVRRELGQISAWPVGRQFRFLTLNNHVALWGRAVLLRTPHTGRWMTARVLDPQGRTLDEVSVAAIAADHNGAMDILVPVDLIQRQGARWLEVEGERVALP